MKKKIIGKGCSLESQKKDYLSIYSQLRVLHKEVPYVEGWMSNEAKSALETLHGVFYLVESIMVAEEHK